MNSKETNLFQANKSIKLHRWQQVFIFMGVRTYQETTYLHYSDESNENFRNY